MAAQRTELKPRGPGAPAPGQSGRRNVFPHGGKYTSMGTAFGNSG